MPCTIFVPLPLHQQKTRVFFFALLKCDSTETLMCDSVKLLILYFTLSVDCHGHLTSAYLCFCLISPKLRSLVSPTVSLYNTERVNSRSLHAWYKINNCNQVFIENWYDQKEKIFFTISLLQIVQYFTVNCMRNMSFKFFLGNLNQTRSKECRNNLMWLWH